jgi:hypothetical protein
MNKPNNELQKLIEAIDLRFVSGNTVPVERVQVRANEWDAIKLALVKAK